MACCSEEMGDYAVTPVLMAPCDLEKCAEGPPLCYPCLPSCPKGQVVYYCEKPQRKCSKNPCNDMPKSISCSKPQSSCHSTPQEYCCPTCNNSCKPIKTKYVIPCYRYEDGRIDNQPTVLMRRACEVAVGARRKRTPFVESSYSEDPDQKVHRYICQDDRGNCCYHYEKENHESCHPPDLCRLYGDCDRANVEAPPRGCYYYCC